MDLRQSINNQIDNSFSLARHVIAAHAEDSNFIFSPLLIHVLLGMIAAGSNAPTRDHKVLIEVSEEGTTAAAVSVAPMKAGCSRYVKRERLEFVADHPFMFVIREDNTGLVLFIGQLLNPLNKA